MARDFYGEEMAGFSIPAAEHSTITAWGEDREADAMANMLTQFPTGLVACVSDSFDIFQACGDIWGTQLRDEVLARDGTLVIRPDSGDPPTVLVKVLHILYEKFGGKINEKGFKVLDDHVRLIQGDAIDFDMLDKILSAMQKHGFSADNIAFGSGGGLLQKLNRDTLKFAFKCSAVQVGDEWRDVFKLPVTDMERSRSGDGSNWFATTLGSSPRDLSRSRAMMCWLRSSATGRSLPIGVSHTCASGRPFKNWYRNNFPNSRGRSHISLRRAA